MIWHQPNAQADRDGDAASNERASDRVRGVGEGGGEERRARERGGERERERGWGWDSQTVGLGEREWRGGGLSERSIAA